MGAAMTDRELMHMALDALFMFVEYDYQGNPLGGAHFNGHKAIEALRARLAQPEPEHRDVVIAGDLWRVEFLPDNDANVRLVRANYTAPPQRQQRTYTLRKWVGLTRKEKLRIWGEPDNFQDPMRFARAIEAKLKEKNT